MRQQQSINMYVTMSYGLLYGVSHKQLQKCHDSESFVLVYVVTFVQIMDTPRPEQVRPVQSNAEVATEEDCLEVCDQQCLSKRAL